MESVTLSNALRELAWHRNALRGLPKEQRAWFLRQRAQFLAYAWWQQLRGRPVQRPICDAALDRHVRVKKQIPGIFIPCFGRRIWLVVPTPLEYEAMDE